MRFNPKRVYSLIDGTFLSSVQVLSDSAPSVTKEYFWEDSPSAGQSIPQISL